MSLQLCSHTWRKIQKLIAIFKQTVLNNNIVYSFSLFETKSSIFPILDWNPSNSADNAYKRHGNTSIMLASKRLPLFSDDMHIYNFKETRYVWFYFQKQT